MSEMPTDRDRLPRVAERPARPAHADGEPAAELLMPDDCAAVLPVNPVVEEHIIARFCLIEADDEQGLPHDVALPRDMVMPEAARQLARWRPDASDEQLRGGVALLQEWNAPALRYPVVDVEDVDAVFDDRRVPLDDRDVSVSLDGEEALDLLSRGRAMATVRRGRRGEQVLLRVRPGIKVQPADDGGVHVVVHDLAAVAADPVVRLPGGQRLQLEAAVLRQLLTTGRITARAGGQAVTVTTHSAFPAAAAADASASSEVFVESLGLAPEPPVFRLAMYLPVRQRWQLLGYARGRVLANLSLAPQEETTIEIFRWDRRRRARSLEVTASRELSGEVTTTSRDSRQVLDETTHDSSSQVQPNGSFSLDLKIVKFDMGADADLRDALREMARTTTEEVDETVARGSSRVNEQRLTKVEETEEIGREERVTRRVRNPNMCHTLNLTYFEWTANYQVTSKVDAAGVRLCVLVDNPVQFYPDSRSTLRQHVDALRPALLAPSLADGFDAARLLEAHTRLCGFACTHCDCRKTTTSAPTDAQRQPAVQTAWSTMCSTFQSLLLTGVGSPLRQVFRSGSGNLAEAALQFRAWMYEQAIQRSAWPVWEYLLGLMPEHVQNVAALAPWAPWLLEQTKKMPAPAFTYNEAGAAQLRQLLAAQPSDALDPVAQFAGQSQTLQSYLRSWAGGPLGVEGDDFIKWLDNNGLFTKLDDLGLAAAVTAFAAAYDTLTATAPAPAADGSDTADVAVAAVYSLQQLAEAAEREQALMLHLREHADYYKAVLWNALPPAERLRHLASYGRLLRLIVPESLGHLGHQLAFPLNPAADQRLEAWLDANVTLNPGLANAPAVERFVTLPTGELALEGRLGRCGLCEDFIDDQRHLDSALKAAQVDAAQAKAEQERAEAHRRTARLNADPPLLDDPVLSERDIRVTVDPASFGLIGHQQAPGPDRPPEP
jgi:hypothetical protein